MSWINVTVEMLDEANGKNENSFINSYGVYTGTIEQAYIYPGNNNNRFFEIKLRTNEGNLILNWFFDKTTIQTYITKNGKQAPYPGIVQVDEIMQNAINKRVMEEIPQQALVERFGDQVNALVFTNLIGKQVTIGVKEEEYETNSNEIKTRLIYAGSCKFNDEECKEKLKVRIEKNPIKKLKKQESIQQTNPSEIPF